MHGFPPSISILHTVPSILQHPFPQESWSLLFCWLVLPGLNVSLLFQIVGSLVDFEGEIGFWNNSANREGVLHLLSFGQMRLQQGTRFVFKGNVGRQILTVDVVALCHNNN